MQTRSFRALMTRWAEMTSRERLADLLASEYTNLTDQQMAKMVALLDPAERQELVRIVLDEPIEPGAEAADGDAQT